MRDTSLTIDGNDTVTITQDGTVSTTADRAYGVESIGGDNTITNFGMILTLGEDAHGIRNTGTTTTINNGGFIRAFGGGSHGIDNTGNSATLTNSGTIASDGVGIRNSGNDARITNTGVINASAHGIRNSGNRATITNLGVIRATGVDRDGMHFTSASRNSTFTNSGIIISEQRRAIRASGSVNNLTVNLNAPGFLGGGILFNNSTTLNITTGASHSVLWQLPDTSVLSGDAPNVSGPVPWFYDAATGQFATFDPTGLTASFNQLADTSNTLARVGRYGLGRARAGDGAGAGAIGTSDTPLAYGDGGKAAQSFDILLATNSGPYATYGPASGRFWITGFGGYANHDGDDATLDQRIDQIGAAIGYAWQQSPETRFSVMAGYMNGTITAESPWADAQDIDSNGVFAGLYGDRRFGPVTVGLGVAGGWQTNDSTRFVNDNLATSGGLYTGESTATSTYD
ncbi:MAG: autotransporter outer membrane beta-barrel domain-containing protein, partial [Pseudomonadota bacterium]